LYHIAVTCGDRKVEEGPQQASPDDFPGESPPTSHIIEPGGARAREQPSGDAMIKTVYEELIIHIDNEELARLLDLEEGFAVQQIEEDGTAFRLIFSRKTNLSEQTPRREERRRFLE
jgi:hypothetical protein